MLDGIIPVLLTPMREDHSIDDNGICSLMQFLNGHNISGLWALGSASEEINIGFEKKIQIAKLLYEINKDLEMSIIIGSGAVSLDDHYHFLDKTSDCSFSGFHILPYDTKMGQTRVINLFNKIADRSPWPVWMYHNPKRGRPFELETIKELSYHPNICGIKMGGYNLTDITKCFMLKNEEFDVVAAGSGQLFQCLSLGANAHTTSEGSVYPQIFQKIKSLYDQQKIKQSLVLQKQWISLNSAIKRTQNGEHCAEEKFLLSLQGVCGFSVNENYEVYPENLRAELENLHEEILKLCES